MKNMNLKIISAFNKSHQDLHEISKKTIINYCDLNHHDYEFFEIPSNFNRPPAWYKIKIILDSLREYNGYIIWMDADSLILNFSINLNKFIDNNILYLACDFNDKNSGFMIIKSNKKTINFFEKVWTMEEYTHHMWWEQAAIIDLYNKNYNNCQSFIKILDQDIFNSYPMEYYGRPKFSKGDVSKKSFTCHFPSLPINLRLDLMNKYYNMTYECNEDIKRI